MSARSQRRAQTKRRALRTRNAHRARGAALTLQEVLRHARPGHQRCKAVTGKPAGVLRNPKTGAYEFCPCAVAGLIEAHPEVILAPDGKAYWPAEDDDAQEDAPGGTDGKQGDGTDGEAGDEGTDGPGG